MADKNKNRLETYSENLKLSEAEADDWFALGLQAHMWLTDGRVGKHYERLCKAKHVPVELKWMEEAEEPVGWKSLSLEKKEQVKEDAIRSTRVALRKRAKRDAKTAFKKLVDFSLDSKDPNFRWAAAPYDYLRNLAARKFQSTVFDKDQVEQLRKVIERVRPALLTL
jgi:hypothetical protein